MTTTPLYSRLAPILSMCLVAAPVRADEPKILFEETFAGKLDKDWSWLREDPKSWRIEKGALIVTANGGSMWRTLNNYKNLLMRPAPVEPKSGFQFEVLLDNDPKRQFEHAGLACRYDDDNYVVLNKEFLGKTELLMISELNAAPLLPGIKKVYEPRAVWLRMTVTEGKVVGHYRASDKDPWLLMGEQKLPLSEKKLLIGLIAGLGADGREATFRRFRVLEAPRRPNESP